MRYDTVMLRALKKRWGILKMRARLLTCCESNIVPTSNSYTMVDLKSH